MNVGRYVGEYSVTPMADGITWYLLAGFKYIAFDGTVVDVPQGFESDFASVPRLLWPIFPPWGTYGPAAHGHDWLYWSQGQAGKMTKVQCDRMFLEMMATSGVWLPKRTILYEAVRRFGQFAWESDGKIAASGVSRIYTGDGLLPGWSRADMPEVPLRVVPGSIPPIDHGP